MCNDNLQQSWCQGRKTKGMDRKLKALNVLLEVPGFFSYIARATDEFRLLILL